MLNLNALPAESEATINRVDPRPLGDDKGLRWDVDLTFPLSSPADVKAADAVVNGTAYLVSNAEQNGTRATLTDKTKRPDTKLTIVDGAGDKIVNGATCEIRFTRLEVNGKVAAVTMRLRMRGAAEQRIGLLSNYGEGVDVQMDGKQVEIPFDGKDERVIETGNVVTMSDGSAGMVKSVNDTEVHAMDVDGTSLQGSRQDVAAVVRVAAPEGSTMAKQMSAYKRRCNRKGIAPTWGDLLKAVNAALANGGATDVGGAWVIDQDIVDAAVEVGVPRLHSIPPTADATTA